MAIILLLEHYGKFRYEYLKYIHFHYNWRDRY